jgi:hypothetical protein
MIAQVVGVPSWITLAMFDAGAKWSGRQIFKLAADGKLPGKTVVVHKPLSMDAEIHDAVVAYARTCGARVIDHTRGET